MSTPQSTSTMLTPTPPPSPPPTSASPAPDDAILGQLKALFTEKKRLDATLLSSLATKRELIMIWRKMRAVLAVNPASIDCALLDEIAFALIEGQEVEASDYFDSTVVLLPYPARQCTGGVPPDHEVFTDCLKRTRPSSSEEKAGSVLVPKAGSHSTKKLKVDLTPTTEEKSKKKKVAPSTKKTKDVEALQTDDEALAASQQADLEAVDAELGEFVPFTVAKATDIDVKRSIIKFFKDAQDNDIDVVSRTYPWAGQYLWLHAPLESHQAQTVRRRLKVLAIAGRNRFVSVMIETWGYYATVHRMESSGHRALFWWGGQPGRHQPHKNYKGSLIDELGTLFKKKDSDAFLQRFRDAMRPARLDRAGFPTLTALLEQNDALNPDDDNKKRGPDLSLEFAPCEGGSKSSTYELPRVAVYKEEESQKEGYTPLMNGDGHYTALPPAHRIPAWGPVHGLVYVINLSNDLEEGEVDQVDDTTGVSTRSQGHPSSFI
ncbi:hypothetical protein PHMEG_00012000 [Phytophthora megakarya]|uniref:Uncharacterized protein n=1 Tax=Phytophthora megakarya TaxID=4795 RepID=A0A225WBJ5_9STRA|nr:hypothetical protein PHMEG_00012000 [Phytophthora megakarya]